MKKVLFSAIIGAGMLVATASQASLSFSSLSGSSVQFGPGSQFDITASSTADANFTGGFAQWQITTAGAAQNLYGEFSGGPWTYGAITINGSVQTANVTPGGTFAIDDGASPTDYLLTGNINWVQISTFGSAGNLNAQAVINISNMTYGGSNSDLQALLTNGGNGSMNLTFQFSTTETLTQLSGLTNTLSAGSYSGTLTPVPEASTLFAGVLLLLPLGASSLRILRRNRMA